ncbi:(E2-independent) E3 ubiquitin-conjugating enzyme FATS isoform X2 [Hippocampus zosterae]|uniref:(E2-independent) E3 ubiquitin-conjugating enzyme FATS isoform X2 n=1 Tax=Hippocampus zosterae TaxID=109293 RepID=UPI00223E524E|nr:(E2-independent) E3 ubiquitin-conjugating enzyme FATS isoform X2 [Hippocampus zosterae]
MALRRPAAHLPTGWRRSGDESGWETRSSKGESFSRRAARPRSAIEGGQPDDWLRQVHRMQGGSRGTEPSRERPYRTPSFGGVSSSWGNLTRSSAGSRESLQSEFFVPVGRTGSLERVHISQTPKKEQSRLSDVAAVKSGWLPIQGRVMKEEDDSQDRKKNAPSHSAAQVKLKQPITPTFLKSRGAVSPHQEGQAERSRRGTWRTPDRSSPVIKQVLGKQSCAAHEQGKTGIWKALRRGWNSNRGSGTQSGQPPTEILSDPHQVSPLVRRTTGEDPPRPFLGYGRPDSVQHGYCSSPDSHGKPTGVEEPPICRPLTTSPQSKVPDPSRGASGAPYRRHSLQPQHIQTTSTPATLIPRTKVGFSSITICSRKVSRSASLTASDGPQTADPQPADPMDRRKATIVKVTEQRTTVSSAPAFLRRKPAIIKVIEHKESYGPGTPSGNREENQTWRQPESPTGVEAGTTSPVQNGEPTPAEFTAQEPEGPAVRKWSLGLPQETPKKAHREAFAARWSSTPCLTLIQTPEPHQSPEEVLALNAAAIIANIKLQRQLSQKKPAARDSEGDPATSPQGDSVRGRWAQAHSNVPTRDEPCPEPAPPTLDLQKSRPTVSLQEALLKSRPRFIARSRERVQQMARRAQERKERSRAGASQTLAPRTPRGAHQQARSINENLSKSREGSKELKSNRPLTEVKKRKEEAKKKKEACLTNRQRVELFKKKLLDQILHRSSN